MTGSQIRMSAPVSATESSREGLADTIVVSAKEASFHKVFLGECCWYPLRIGTERLKTLRWIAVYQTAPVRSITHYAKIVRIVDYLDTGRYKIVFEGPIELDRHISLDKDRHKTFQGQRYTTLEKLSRSAVIDDLRPWQ